jgi:hypothetical protein
MARGLGWLIGSGALLCLGLVACGDDDSAAGTTSGGCTTDIECKGDRVCEDGECVDPHGAGDSDGGSGSGGSTHDGGTAAEAGSGGKGTSGQGGGTSGSGGTHGGAGSMVIDDPELEAACSLDCMARNDAACEMNIGSLDQCLGQCLVIDESNHGYCLDEMTARYACLASGGYSCVSGYPQPKATCLPEAQALATCSQMTPCRMFCDKAAGTCAPAGDECMVQCMEQTSMFEDAICGIYYTQLISCWGTDLSCENGKPAVGKCGSAVAEVADCVGRRNEACDGFCWAADALGCAPADCVTACKVKTSDSNCGSYYRSLIECSYEYSGQGLALSCVGGEPTPDPTECMSQKQQYDMCMATH